MRDSFVWIELSKLEELLKDIEKSREDLNDLGMTWVSRSYKEVSAIEYELSSTVSKCKLTGIDKIFLSTSRLSDYYVSYPPRNIVERDIENYKADQEWKEKYREDERRRYEIIHKNLYKVEQKDVEASWAEDSGFNTFINFFIAFVVIMLFIFGLRFV